MRKRTTEIIVERDELLLISRRAGPLRAWCEGCAADAEMLMPEEAAALAGLTARQVYRLAEASLVHFAETPGGLLLVCPNSILSIKGGPAVEVPE